MKNNRIFLIAFLIPATIACFAEGRHEHISLGTSSIFLFILILLLIIVVTLFFLLRKNRSWKNSGKKAADLNELSMKVLKKRFANGEISKKEYNLILHELELTEDESIETTKFCLAKGEISIEEYDKINYTIGN